MIEIPKTEYEDIPFLNAEIVKKNPTFVIVEPAPHMVTIKSGFSQGKQKLCITMQTKKGTKYVWFANDTSARFLVDKLGNDENKHLGKTVELIVREMVVQGKDTEVIYAKGSLKKKEDKKK